ncbi:MAG: toll/interleukin-1 receptor domain-containing protein [Pseudomonadota bacterium]
MAQVYLIGVPENEPDGEALADFLRTRGHVLRTEYGKFGFAPARRGEVTLALWSRAAMMSVKRLMMTNRAIDAWETGHLVMARLDHGIIPQGLGDIEMIDLSFEPAREHRYLEVDRALREIARPTMPAGKARSIESDAHAPSAEAMTEALQEDPAKQVFISYAHADADAVLPLVDVVEAAGKSVWIDRDGMRAGQGWAGMIVRAIKAARMVCLMCSERAFASDHVRREVYLADKYKKGILPVRLDQSDMPEDIEYFLAGVQWVDLDGLPLDQHGPEVAAAFAA